MYDPLSDFNARLETPALFRRHISSGHPYTEAQGPLSGGMCGRYRCPIRSLATIFSKNLKSIYKNQSAVPDQTILISPPTKLDGPPAPVPNQLEFWAL
jgi:hypothetical protein